MRVLIVLALIGVAYAGEAFLAAAPFAAAPLAYSSVYVDEPKPSYEYSTSVQTPTYNNFAHVRSGGNFERKFYNFATPIAAPIVAAAAPEPIIAEAKFIQPAIAQPVLKAAPLNAEYSSYAAPAIAQPVLKAAPLSAEYSSYAAPAIALPTTKLLPIAYEAKPVYRFAAPTPAIIAAAPAPAQILKVENKYYGEGKSQYHSQNELGEATYGHREAFQSHDAVQDAQGNKAGSFSYVAPDGRVLTTEYIADQAGYRVASNALPNAPNAIAPAPIAPAIAAVEKPAEFGDSEVIVEAKSRSRRSADYYSPLAYSAPYSYPAVSTYSYAPAYSPAYSPYYSYNSPYYRSYAYSSYPSYYYKSFPFRK